MFNYVWFRSDLRVQDNPALHSALTGTAKTEVRAIFYVTLQQWQEHAWGANKIGFVLQCVIELQKDLATLNVPLEIRYCNTFNDCVSDLCKYLQQQNACGLYFNKEYELNEQNRDTKVIRAFDKTAVKVVCFDSQCLIAPGLILTKQNTPYTVYTPFKKACYEYLYRHPVKLIITPRVQNAKVAAFSIDPKLQKYLQNPILKLWPCDRNSVSQRLEEFCADKIDRYQEARDYPALQGTSTLSPYLAVGRISVQQCFTAALSCNRNEFAVGNPNIVCWISELIWRDFYKHIMWHFPDLCKGHNFNHKYDKLKWDKPGKSLELWQTGNTGIPIIDAAMRQLVQTGWMHNRLRMIVAMFLSKNLLIDWRHGEKFFSEHLVDLDLAANNGGWQWSASTGTDAAPYFRIFNPITQSEKFDPDGKFIKQYCAELQDVSLKALHDPSCYLTAMELQMLGYPERIVDLSASRQRALSYFKNL
jgi:deoxyribodipyrimidine photo-lyase